VSAPTTDLRDLAAHLGAAVQVGGLVTDIATGGVRLDDGTATARLLLDGEAASLTALLNPGDAISATGIVEQRDELVVVVGDPAALTIAGDPSAPDTEASPQTSPGASAAIAALVAGTNALRGGMGGMSGPGTTTLAGATLLLAGLAGLVAAAAHRSRERRRLRARILGRLEALAGAETVVATVANGG